MAVFVWFYSSFFWVQLCKRLVKLDTWCLRCAILLAESVTAPPPKPHIVCTKPLQHCPRFLFHWTVVLKCDVRPPIAEHSLTLNCEGTSTGASICTTVKPRWFDKGIKKSTKKTFILWIKYMHKPSAIVNRVTSQLHW